ncbi:MAG: DUF202 domain-containing protein [Acidimicrobiia bacterium]
MPRPLDEDDEGLAPERTALAWNRTGIAFLVAIAALGRRVWPIDRGNHGFVVGALGFATLLFLASLWVATRLATRHRYEGETMDATAFRLVTVGTLVVAVAGLALALFPT